MKRRTPQPYQPPAMQPRPPGRPPRPIPTTIGEAAAELRRYLPEGVTATGRGVVLTVDAVVRLLAALRHRRTPPTTSETP